jgi:hypothetical protein
MITLIISVQAGDKSWVAPEFLRKVDVDELEAELSRVFDKWAADAVARRGRILLSTNNFEITVSKHGG